MGHGSSHWITGTFFLLLPKIREEFGFSYAEISLIGTIYYIGSLASTMIGGPAVDVTGRRILFQIGSLLMAGLALVGLGLSSNFYLIAFMGILIAAANNLWHPAAMSFLSSEYPRNRAFVLSLHVIGSNIGEALSPIVAGAILTWSVWGWQSAAFVNAIPALLMAAIFIVAVLPKDKPVAGASRPGIDLSTYAINLLRILKDKVVLGLSMMAGFRSMAQSGLKLFLPFYIIDVLGLPYAYAGIALTALLVGGLVASPVAAAYADRIGRRRVVMMALGASTLVIVGLTFVGNGTAYVVGISLLGFTMFAVRPVIQGWMMDLVPRTMAGSAISLMFSIQAFMSAITPLVGGVIADHYGLVAVFYFLGAILLLANLVVFFLPKEEARAEAAD
jgi:MFS transporter, FSR family, fosmidomycin resistance protein